jgi:predicted O-methyltransferase YrrM
MQNTDDDQVWTPLALPALELVKPRMRPGAVVFMDNVITSAKGYADLFAYLADKKNGFRYTQVPYNNGFGMAVFTGV